jgi:protein-tyrosine phosphatase
MCAGSARVRSAWDDLAVSWELGAGVVQLPDGTRLRGWGRAQVHWPDPDPEWALCLLGERPEEMPCSFRWVRWPDFGLPDDRRDARAAFAEAHALAQRGVRVQVMCQGGIGRTGTALACIAQLAGVSSRDAVSWVRANYHSGAVETPWQQFYVRHLWRRARSPA